MRENQIMKEVSIIIPAFNEEQSIHPVINKIEEVLIASNVSYEIIVVDDGSTDRTCDIVEKTNAKLIRHDHNMGYGASLKTGVRHSKFDKTIIIDADSTYPEDALPQLLEKSQQYDMVVGARTGENVYVPVIRRPAKWVLNKLANFLTGTKIKDLNSGFRIFKKDSLLRFINLLPDGFSFTTTITIAMLTSNYTVKYLPINYYKRKGKSKIRPIKDTINFLVLIIRIVLYFKPLKVLLPLSMILFSIDLLKIVFDIIKFNWHIATSTILVGIVAFNVLIIGLVADMIATLRKNNVQ